MDGACTTWSGTCRARAGADGAADARLERGSQRVVIDELEEEDEPPIGLRPQKINSKACCDLIDIVEAPVDLARADPDAASVGAPARRRWTRRLLPVLPQRQRLANRQISLVIDPDAVSSIDSGMRFPVADGVPATSPAIASWPDASRSTLTVDVGTAVLGSWRD